MVVFGSELFLKGFHEEENSNWCINVAPNIVQNPSSIYNFLF